MEQLLLIFCMVKKKNISCLSFKTKLKSWKTSYSLNNSIWKKTRMVKTLATQAKFKGQL